MADVGKILIRSRGNYDAATEYEILDVVRYDNKLWCCKAETVTGVAPAEGTYWTMWAQDGQDGTGVGDMTKAEYATNLNAGVVDTAVTLKDLTATVTELNYVHNVTSAIQTQLDGKVNTVVGKGLSTNDYTDADQTAVGTISSKLTGQIFGSPVAAVTSSGVTSVTFSGIDTTKNYELYMDLGTSYDAAPASYNNVKLSHTGSGSSAVYSLKFTLVNATAGREFILVEIG